MTTLAATLAPEAPIRSAFLKSQINFLEKNNGFSLKDAAAMAARYMVQVEYSEEGPERSELYATKTSTEMALLHFTDNILDAVHWIDPKTDEMLDTTSRKVERRDVALLLKVA